MLLSKRLMMLLFCTSLIGCYNTQSYKPTPEQQALVQQMQAKMLANMQGRTVPTTQPEIKVELTEQSLLAKKQHIFDLGKPGVFRRKKNQLFVNDKPFIDREGRIGKIGKSEVSGEFTYLISNGLQKILKYNRVNSNQESLKVATILKDIEGIKVVTVSGAIFKGSHFTPTANGFLVSRAGTVFKYVIGEKEQVYPVKQGYHVASFQNGDVSATNYILLEKDEDTSQSGGLMSSFKGLGSTLGLNKDYGYLLVNINNNDFIPVNISTGDKNITIMSNCRKKNNFVNECENSDSVESLYEADGRPNYSHYYWSVNWLMSKNGPIVIYKESSKVKLVELETKRIYTLFERMLGVNYIDVTKNANGKVSVFAKLGFSSEEVSDIDSFIRDNRSMSEVVDLNNI